MINILFGFVTCTICTISASIFSFSLWSLILPPNIQLCDFFFLTKQVVTTAFQALFSDWVSSRLWSPSSVRIPPAWGILMKDVVCFFPYFYFFQPVISPLSLFNCFMSLAILNLTFLYFFVLSWMNISLSVLKFKFFKIILNNRITCI